jgi:hypothetical protein
MSDERYTRPIQPLESSRDTEVDPEPPVMIGVRYAPHRIEQTLHFPQLTDEFLTT